MVVWWKGGWGLQRPHFTTAAKSLFLSGSSQAFTCVGKSQILMFLLFRNLWLPINMHQPEAESNTWIPSSLKSHMKLRHLHWIFPSLCFLASSAIQGINSATDVIFHLQHSYSLHKCLLGAPLKETSQGWNCEKTHKGCLLPYYFYSLWFLAMIECFLESIKRQSRTLLLCFVYFILLRGTKESSPS